jgi:hypothetical protein
MPNRPKTALHLETLRRRARRLLRLNEKVAYPRLLECAALLEELSKRLRSTKKRLIIFAASLSDIFAATV